MYYKITFFCIILSVFLVDCAGVKFYSDPTSKHKNAIKVHLPKPFLLVEYSPTPDIALKSSIIYLPDLSESLYIQPKNGLGTSDIKFNLANGYLSEFGVVTDSKMPETITALTEAATAVMAQPKNQEKKFELYEIKYDAKSNGYLLQKVLIE